MRNTMDNVIDYFNFEGYLKLLEQKTPKKIVYENMDMLYIYWNVFRGNVNDNRNEILEWLKKENIVETHRERVSAVNKYEKYKEDLAYFGVRQTNKLDRIIEILNPVVKPQKVGNRMLTITDDKSDAFKVMDISEGRENIVALLFKKGGISWRDENLHPFEMKWIVDEAKNLKSNRKEIVL